LADDISIDFEKMKLWDKEQVTYYFENGGEEPPAEWQPPPCVPLTPVSRRATLRGCRLSARVFWSTMQLALRRTPHRHAARLVWLHPAAPPPPTALAFLPAARHSARLRHP